jgi:hypothetical protein
MKICSILQDLCIPELANKSVTESGLDSYDQCLDQDHFKKFPYPVHYQYNSRGFRDQEWPSNLQELKDAVWVVGDSFTSGVGSPLAHTWPTVLAKSANRRVINVSLDGASNTWIARRCCDIYHELQPPNIVIMWSYTHRRENSAKRLSDMQRKIYCTESTWLEDYENFKQCRQQVQDHCTNSNIVELVIPGWQPVLAESHGTDDYLRSQQLQNQHLVNLIEVPKLDLARDGHHFDIKTVQWLVPQILAAIGPVLES